MMITVRRFAAFAPSLVLFVFPLAAQQDRLPSQINRSRNVVLPGRVPARARAGKDLGQVSSSFSMPDLVLLLKGSTSQQQALTKLIQQQQDPASSNYHQWLTPEPCTDADLRRIVERQREPEAGPTAVHIEAVGYGHGV